MSDGTATRTAESLGDRPINSARKYARAVVGALRSEDFCKNQPMTWGNPPEWDVYAVSNEDGSWYVKVNIDAGAGQLIIASCHLLERPMQREDGTWLNP